MCREAETGWACPSGAASDPKPLLMIIQCEWLQPATSGYCIKMYLSPFNLN
jgi:hypothetical protein